MRTIELSVTVKLSQMTKDQAEDAGLDWADFDTQGELDAVEPANLADCFEAQFEDQYFIDDLLAGSEIFANVTSVKMKPVL